MPIAQIRGTDLYHETTGGEGDVVVFVNGGFADHSNWLFVAPILAESFNVVLFDGRGHGQSTGEVVEEPFDSVDDLAGLIEFLDCGPVHVVGNSGGGLYAMHLAARRPEVFRSLSVNEPPFISLLTEDPLGSDTRGVFMETGARFREGDTEAGVRGFLAFVGIDWELFPPPFKEMVLNNARNYRGRWYADATHPIWAFDAERLQRFPHPMQLTTGSNTVPALASITRTIAELLPTAELSVIDGAGHGPMFDRPAEYAAVLSQFVKDAGAA